jgi:hypothetical protein
MPAIVTERILGGAVTPSGRTWRRQYTVKDPAGLSEVSAVAALAGSSYAIVASSAHPEDSAALCSSIDPEINADRTLCTISVTWETPRFGGGTTNPNPTARAPEVEWDYEGAMEPIFEDTDGVPILNSAGERFDPLPEAERGELTLRYIRNEASINLTQIREYQNSVNSDTFTVAGVAVPARVAKLTIRPGRKTEENGFTYYPIEYHFKFKADEWRVELLDVGLSEWFESTIEGVKIRRPILDEQGLEITSPIRLDGLGGALPDADPSEYVGPFKFYAEKDFSVFSFT